MKKIRETLMGGNRYEFDFHRCTSRKGWAQMDTRQDAWYFGMWAHPVARKIVSWCEGDLTVLECESDEEFVTQIRAIRDWNVENELWIGLDCGMPSNGIAERFRALGLDDLLIRSNIAEQESAMTASRAAAESAGGRAARPGGGERLRV